MTNDVPMNKDDILDSLAYLQGLIEGLNLEDGKHTEMLIGRIQEIKARIFEHLIDKGLHNAM